MDRISLKAEERTVLGKKVNKLRREGFIPAHVFGKKVETEHVTVKLADFAKVFAQAGETGLINLKIGEEKVRPVLIREVQIEPFKGAVQHIDFYQVNLAVKVKVAVPINLKGEETELVHNGEAVVIQPMGEVEVEALPAKLPEQIEVDITPLQAIGDVITVSQLQVPSGVEVMADPEAVVAKLDSAVTEEMKALMEEQAAEAEAQAAAAAAEAGTEEGAEVPAEGEAAEGHGPEESKGEAAPEGEAPKEGEEAQPSEEKSRE